MSPPALSRPTLIVTLEPGADLSAVAERLQASGFVVEQTLEAIGTLSGYATSDNLEELRRIPGVLEIEADRGIQLPDPDAGPTW